jgi:flagellar basal-body rod protein FlgC
MPDVTRLPLLPTLQPRPTVRPMFRALGLAAGGLSAQRQRIETIAGNLANAETTRTDAGGPYKRKVAVLQAASPETRPFGALLPGAPGAAEIASGPLPFGSAAFQVPATAAGDGPSSFTVPALPQDDGVNGVRVAEIAEDRSEGPLVYEPGHPDADANGYVRYPNVRVSDEMIALIDARRIYEANATVFQSAKAMLKAAINI